MTNSTYQNSLEVEALAKQRLLPFLQKEADGGLVIDVYGKNALGLLIQKSWGDYLANHSNMLYSIELKADRNDSNRICIEVASNFIFDNYPEYLKRGHTPGWALTSRSMLLFYYWIETDRLAVIDLYALQNWAFAPTQGGVPKIEEHQQNQYGEVRPRFPYFTPHAKQKNRTWMRWVPLRILERELNPAPIVTNVQQLFIPGYAPEIFKPAQATGPRPIGDVVQPIVSRALDKRRGES